MKLLDQDVVARVEAAARGLEIAAWEQGQEWHQLGLMTGVIGLGLCATSVDRAVGDGHTTALADAVLVRAIELFNVHGAGPSLHAGVAGLGLLLALNFDYPELLTLIDGGLIHELERKPSLLSLRAGVAGLAIYAATRSATPTGRRLGDTIVRILADRARTESGTLTWDVPRAYASDRGLKVIGEPILEAGMAHGHTGILAGLAALAAAGNATAADLIPPALDWLWAAARPPPNRYAWATFGSDPELRVKELNVNTWCTGDPGVVRGAWLAARAVGDAGHTERALELARAVAAEVLAGRTPGLPDRHDLCCGAAAVGHIFHRFFEDTSEPVFRDAAIATLSPLIDKLPAVASTSFQFGRSGTLTALLTASTDVPLDWDVAFGMSLPKPAS